MENSVGQKFWLSDNPQGQGEGQCVIRWTLMGSHHDVYLTAFFQLIITIIIIIINESSQAKWILTQMLLVSGDEI